jgi:hypothetical protein
MFVSDSGSSVPLCCDTLSSDPMTDRSHKLSRTSSSTPFSLLWDANHFSRWFATRSLNPGSLAPFARANRPNASLGERLSINFDGRAVSRIRNDASTRIARELLSSL